MYVPPHARESRVDVLHAAIDGIAFGTLATVADGRPTLTHLPMLRVAGGPLGTIVGHVSRANPQWRLATGTLAVAAFVGPSFYVSPNVYATKAQGGRVVPTWNYIAVEAAGPIEFFDERSRLLALVRSLTDRHEATQTAPWHVDDAPDDYIAGQLAGIVGFELRVETLVGAWKLSRNKSDADRAGVAAVMRANDDPALRALAELALVDATVASSPAAGDVEDRAGDVRRRG